jgi:hypothetical protein
MTGNGERKISSLRDLPLDIAPPRDLWQGIEERIVSEQAAAGGRSSGASDVDRRFGRAARMRVLAAAAVIAALAVGIWIGRAVLPTGGQPSVRTVQTSNPPGSNARGTAGSKATGSNTTGAAAGQGFVYVADPRYTRERAELVKNLEAHLAALPPESRAKVMASLKAINDSKRELETELGKDPSNALLQELLVNTYQDEMRVLTAVDEAGAAGEGI